MAGILAASARASAPLACFWDRTAEQAPAARISHKTETKQSFRLKPPTGFKV